MKFTLKKFKESARFNWKIGFALTAYFLLLALVNILFKSEIPFMILAWPGYIFPEHAGFAAIMEMLFAYFIATILVMVFEDVVEKKISLEKHSNKGSSKEEKEHSTDSTLAKKVQEDKQ